MAKRKSKKRGEQKPGNEARKVQRQRQDTEQLRATAKIEKVTALQYTIHYLSLCAQEPQDLTKKPGAVFLARIIVTLWDIARQFPKHEPELNAAAEYLARAANDPCDFSNELERVEALVNSLLDIKPGPG
jgi:MoxR-like ATPase